MALTTDPTPRLTAAEVLQDEHRMKRLKAALCDGIFAYAEGQVATRILDDCLKVCGGSAETLSAVVQTKFFVEHTPFYWIITNRPPTKPGAPPLLVRLLSVCEELNQETQDDIIQVLYPRYESGVYAAVKPKLTGVPTHEAFQVSSFFQDPGDQPVITMKTDSIGSLELTLSLDIPKFFDRLSVEGEFWFEVPYTFSSLTVRVRACLEPVSRSNASDKLYCKFEVTARLAKYPGSIPDQKIAVRLTLLASTKGENLPLTAGKREWGILLPAPLPLSLCTGMTLEELFR